MDKDPFVKKDSIVKTIWASSDTVLFIFAGAAAEFALNKAIDWLYFTGKLPADPLGRLFSTVTYAHRIIFASKYDAHKAIDSITAIHGAVEHQRKAQIPDWAYRDVLYMLIHYSISAYELLERPLAKDEKDEVYAVFYRMGVRMGLTELPISYDAWLPDRKSHMGQDLACSQYTPHLFAQYKKHLGWVRYAVMLQVQALLVPEHVLQLLKLKRYPFFIGVVNAYKLMKRLGLHKAVYLLVMPAEYGQQIAGIDKINS